MNYEIESGMTQEEKEDRAISFFIDSLKAIRKSVDSTRTQCFNDDSAGAAESCIVTIQKLNELLYDLGDGGAYNDPPFPASAIKPNGQTHEHLD